MKEDIMLKVESTHPLLSNILAGLALIVGAAFFPAQSFGQEEEPICSAVPEDPCDVTTFAGLSTGNYGTSFSSNGFFFQYFPGQSNFNFEIEDKNNLRKSLRFRCNYAAIELPNPRQYVTLLFHGIPARVNFIAVNGAGAVVDETRRYNDTPSEGAESVMLGPASDRITAIYMHVVDTNQCDAYNCSMPAYLSDIRACDIATK
jgi:hypothetical protein